MIIIGNESKYLDTLEISRENMLFNVIYFYDFCWECMVSANSRVAFT